MRKTAYKKIFSASIIIVVAYVMLIFAGRSLAVFNEKINYQGKLTDTNGQAVAEGYYCMKFALYDALTGGNLLWFEEWKTDNSHKVHIVNGLFSVLLGSQTSISSVDFNNASRYLEVQLDATCNDSYEEVFDPRKLLGAVTSAFEAKKLAGKTWAAPGAIGETTPVAGNFATIGVTTQGTGAFTTLSASTALTAPIQVSSATGVALTATSGVLTMAGLKSAGYNENLTIDFETTANQVAIGTGTGVTTISLGSLALTTTGAVTTGNLQTGANGADGQLTIYSEQGATDYSLVFQPNAAMTESSTYVFPAAKPASNKILQSDLSGNLTWVDAGAGTVTGTGAATRVAYWSTASALTSNAGFTFDETTLTAPVMNITTESSGYQADSIRLLSYRGSSGTENLFLGQSGNFTTTGTKNIFAGYQAGLAATTGYGNQFIGYQAGYSTTTGSNDVFLGEQAGYTNITGVANVFLGYQAGYYETGSNKLFIDNQQRTNEADARTKALVYGIFDAATANQSLAINGSLKILEGGASSQYYTTFTAGDQAGSIGYTLPTALPDSNKVLQSTSSGVLSWVSQGGGIGGSGTINEIAYWAGANTLGTLAVATYPSLTELSYVKGLSSAIQTQLNAKGVGDMLLASVQSVTGLKTFDTTKLAVKGSSTGATAVASANASATDYTQTLQARTGTLANLDNVTFIGTTSVALNRSSAALTLAGITLTTPDIGTPSAGVLTSCTGLPIAGLVNSTSAALGLGSIELGHASDTTIARVSAGVVSVEGKNIYLAGGTDVAVADGGTGLSSMTAYALLAGGTTTTGALQQVSGLGTSGYVLTSNGAAALPTWQVAGTGTVTGTGAATRVAYWSTASALTSNAGFTFDETTLTAPVMNITTESSGYQADSIRLLSYRGSSGTENLFLGQSGNFTTTGTKNIFAGYQAGLAATTGYGNQFIGYQAGYSTTTGSNDVFLGEQAGYTNITGVANVFLGYQAGYYETGSNKLFIDNQQRTNEADARTKALVYGIFDAAVANQSLTVNGNTNFSAGLTTLNYGIVAPTLTTNGQVGVAYVGTSNRFYWYSNSGLHYVDATAGFEIPGYETVDPISGDKMKIGDIVLGMINRNVGDEKTAEESSLHGIWVKWDSVKAQLLSEARGELSRTGTWGEGSITGVQTETLLDKVINVLFSLGISIENGITQIKELAVEKSTTQIARVEKLEMVDGATGDVYCTWIENGDWQKSKGECSSIEVAIAVPQQTEQLQPSIEEVKQEVKQEVKKELKQELRGTIDITVNEVKEDVRNLQENVEQLSQQQEEVQVKVEEQAQQQEEVQVKVEEQTQQQQQLQEQQEEIEATLEEQPAPVLETINENITETIETISEDIIEAIEVIKETVTETIPEAAGSLFNRIKDFFKGIFKQTSQEGVAPAGSFFNRIWEGFKGLFKIR